MRLLRSIPPIITLALLLAACTPANTLPPPSSSPSTRLSSSPYPVSKATKPSAQAYPSNSPTHDPSIIPFSINKPLQEGATQVTGTGPAGVPIRLQDITFMGDLVAETVIGDDGTFTFTVAPLEQKHRLGIALGDLTNTRWQPEDFYSNDYRGNEPMAVPQMDFFYDTAFVMP
jgi:hypothetical protein